MTRFLATDLKSGSIDASLNEIDSRSKEPERTGNGGIVVGPFSVFSFDNSASSAVDANTPTTLQRGAAAQDSTGSSFDEMVTNQPSPDCLGSLVNTTDDDVLQWDDLFNLQLAPSWDALLNAPLETSAMPFDLSFGEGGMLPDTPQSLQHRSPSGNLRVDESDGQQMAPPQPSSTGEAMSWADVLADAPFLLKHFQDELIAVMMPLPVEKSTWMIMNIPSAKLTLGELVLFGRDEQKLSHARLANFYCVLACSAYLLSVNPANSSADHWKQITGQTYRTAKSHIQESLRTEVTGPRRAKYKDQLMAIEGMAMFAVRHGCPLASRQAAS